MKIAMDEKNVKSFAEVRCAKPPVGMDFKNHYSFLNEDVQLIFLFL
jgi:hypothetical protein